MFTGAFQLGKLAVPKVRVVAFGVSAAATAALWGFLRFSDWGRALRAAAQEPVVAQTCGIDVRRVRVLTFGIAAALAALAGTLLAMMVPVDPQLGGILVLKAFAVIVLGGLGNFVGALVGSLFLGCAEVLAAYYVSPVLSEAVAFLLMIGVLLFKRWSPLEAMA